MIRHEQVVVTTDASGAGTATTTRSIAGLVYEVRGATPALGTATYTITRKGDGGTILTGSQIAPWSVHPRGQVNSGGSAVAHIPCDDHVRVVLASGPASQSGTVHVYYGT